MEKIGQERQINKLVKLDFPPSPSPYFLIY